jgi:signal transduction histidine kinase
MRVETTWLIMGLVGGWLTLLLGLLLYRLVQGWWRKRRYGAPIDHSILLMEYGYKLTNAGDPAALGQLLTQEIAAKLQVRKAALLLPEAYQLSAVGRDDLSIPISHAAVRWVTSAGEAQRANQGRLHELIEQGRTDLTWTQVWVPLMRGTDLHGMWLLGAREGDVHYSPADLRWLTSIAREAAAVLEAMRFTEQERQAASEMRALYRQLVSAREAERGRLSRELHDGVLQDLCAVARDLKALETKRESNEASYGYLVNLSSETVHSLRTICNDLRPPLLQQDLASALKALVEDMDARSQAPVYIEVLAQKDDLRLPDDVALAVFRITQEALNNAIQHADASEIAIRLTKHPDRLRLTVTDDGQGIAGTLESANFVAQGHFGVAGMRERAAMIGGKLDVQTSVGYGTVVILELPC